MATTPETCTSAFGCKGTDEACLGQADINDQMGMLLNDNYHEQTPEGVEGFLKRKEQNVLPHCLRQAALRARIKLARQEAEKFFQE